jgi:hypothetical protein
MLGCVALLLVSLGAVMFFSGFSSLAARAGEPKAAVLSVGLLVVVFLLVGFTLKFITPILGLVGSSLCMFVSPQTGAWGCMLASLILDAIAGLLSLVLLLPGLGSSVPGAAALTALPAFVLSFVAWVMFMIALYRLSTRLKEGKMAEEAIEILIRGVAILVCTPAILFLLVALAGSVAGALFAPPILLGSLYYLFLFLRRQLDLIGSLRQVIASRW